MKEEKTLLKEQKETLIRDVRTWHRIVLAFAIASPLFFLIKLCVQEGFDFEEYISVLLKNMPVLLFALVVADLIKCIIEFRKVKLYLQMRKIENEQTEEVFFDCSEVKFLIIERTRRVRIIGVRLRDVNKREYVYILSQDIRSYGRTKAWLREQFMRGLTLKCYKGTNFVREHNAYAKEEFENHVTY